MNILDNELQTNMSNVDPPIDIVDIELQTNITNIDPPIDIVDIELQTNITNIDPPIDIELQTNITNIDHSLTDIIDIELQTNMSNVDHSTTDIVDIELQTNITNIDHSLTDIIDIDSPTIILAPDLPNNHIITDYSPGHIKNVGKNSHKYRNSLWYIENTETHEKYIIMSCSNNVFIKLCPEGYQRILDYEQNILNGEKMTWFMHLTKYIGSTNNIYMHQIIMNCYGNGRGTKEISVDHIDKNPLNNMISNLRIATRKMQEDNSNGIQPGTKRKRKHNAIELPESITQSMMKKYVVYYFEWLDKEHTKSREFFKVEKHPALMGKIWMTSKSQNVSIHDKLNEANEVVDKLDQGILPIKNESPLPKYISLSETADNKSYLVFDRKIDKKRMNYKMALPSNYHLDDEIQNIAEKIAIKYDGYDIFDK
jgi:hypothetical protein